MQGDSSKSVRGSLVTTFPKDRRPNEVLYTANIATYELGGLVRSLIYYRHCNERNDESSCRAYRAEAKVALEDLITQCRIFAEQLGFDFEELIISGEERFRERMKELEEKII